MAADVALAFGWAGTALAILLNVPQAWRTCVRGETAGVPAARFWVLLLNSVTWLGYGLYGGGAVQIACNSVVSALCVALLIRLTRAKPNRTHVALWVLLTGATIGLGAFLNATLGMTAVGYLAAIICGGIAVPQWLTLVRNRTLSTAGVSRLSCWLSLACCVTWTVYGLLRGETPVWLGNLPALVFTAWTLILLGQSSRVTGSSVQDSPPVVPAVVPAVVPPGVTLPVGRTPAASTSSASDDVVTVAA